MSRKLNFVYGFHKQCGSAGKESACNVGDLGLIPGLGRSAGEIHGLYSPWGHKESDTTE